MSLTFHVRTDELWPAGWYPATIKSVERVPNKFADDESLKFIVLLRREDGEEREHWDWCSLPTSTKSKGYAWYRGVMGADPPKGTCPMGDLLGMDCEARLEVKVKEDGGKTRYDFQYTDKYGYKKTMGGLSHMFEPEFWNYAKLISGVLRHEMPIADVVNLVQSLKLDSESINNWKNGVERALKKYIPNGTKAKGTCGECRSNNLVYEEGCLICKDCGSSKCG